MKAAVCAVCARPSRFNGSVDEGAWVAFDDYAMLDPDMEGHPRGLEYFCSLHVSEALMMTPVVSQVAVADLRKKFDAAARSAARRDAGS